jgi:hypothetical protein
MLLMHVFLVYTCFLYKYFSSSVDGDTRAPYACILYTLVFCESIFCRSFHGNTHAYFCRPYMTCTQIFKKKFEPLYGRWYHLDALSYI